MVSVDEDRGHTEGSTLFIAELKFDHVRSVIVFNQIALELYLSKSDIDSL